MFRRMNPIVRLPLFAIELMWLFQVRFPLKVVGLHLSAQADGEVDFEDIPVFGVCRCPGCHDFSLYLCVLVLFLDSVVLSQVYISLDIFYQHINCSHL